MLTLVRAHDHVSIIKEKAYFACADFKGEAGENVSKFLDGAEGRCDEGRGDEDP